MTIEGINIKKLSWHKYETSDVENVIKMLEDIQQEMSDTDCLVYNEGYINSNELQTTVNTLQEIIKANGVVEIRDKWEPGRFWTVTHVTC